MSTLKIEEFEIETTVASGRSQNEVRQRVQSANAINVFRAIVCLEIVSLHIYGAVPVELEMSFGWVISYFMYYLRFGFESFFVLAGFFMAKSFRAGKFQVFSLSTFLQKRMIRLAIPYWIAIIFGVLLFEVSRRVREHSETHPGTSNLLPLFLFVQDIFPTGLTSVVYWFMAPLMQFIVFWCGIYWLCRKCFLCYKVPEFHDFSLVVVQWVVTLWFVVSLGVVTLEIPVTWRLLDNGIFLAIGALAYWWIEGKLRFPFVFPVALVFMLLVGMNIENYRIIPAVVAVIVILLCMYVDFMPSLTPLTWLGLVGGWSYSIYLTHTYFVYRIMNIPGVLGWNLGIFGWFLMTVAALVVSVALGAIFYLVVERPCMRYAARFSYKKSA